MNRVSVVFPEHTNFSEFLDDIKPTNLEVDNQMLLVKFDYDETLIEVAQDVFNATILH